MNKHTHQLIFNAARGCIMAVAETARNQGKANGRAVAPLASLAALCATLKPLSFALWGALGLVAWLGGPAQAQIVADPSAPATQRPTVLAAPNGVPLVNIQTPSAAGVSRNTYEQFDVGMPGAVLNNSRTEVQTQLGGWVQGNPWLAGGSAKVILNEVNSSHPSQLNGFVEVAGQRAEVVIANPAGIHVNGAGFINASRATLTTGTPLMNGGHLEGFRVQRGSVSIEGAGLNASQTDYTGVLARAIELNAHIHAQQLNMVVGVNTLDAATGEVQNGTAPAAQDEAPSFALDVSELGGMYAGHIRLIGTEAGVGVRHHGTLAASAGDVHIDANGWLSSAGRIEAAQNLTVHAEHILNRANGELRSQGTTVLDTARHGIGNDDGSVTNHGLIDGADTRIHSHEVDNVGTGRIYGDRVAIQAHTLTNREATADEQTTAATVAARERLDIGAQHLTNREGALIFSAGDLAIGGALDAAYHAITDGSVNAQTLHNHSATLESLGHMALATDVLRNTNEHLSWNIVMQSQSVQTDYYTAQGHINSQNIAWHVDGQRLFLPATSAYAAAEFKGYYQGPQPFVPAHHATMGHGESEYSVYVPDSFHYGRTSPIWAAMGLSQPAWNAPGPRPQSYCDEGGCTNIAAELAQWEQQAAPWHELNNRYAAFRTAVNQQLLAYDVYRRYTETLQGVEMTSSQPGRISVGGDLHLNLSGLGLNQDSHIVVGGAITGQLGELKNQATQVQAPTLRSGTVYDWGTVGKDCDLLGLKCDPEYGWRSNAYQESVARAVALPVLRHEQHTAPEGSGTTLAARSHPDGSLFTVIPENHAHYLIETDPRFASYREWLSSDYLLSALAIDPATTQKRLGDGFYEQKLIREQVAALTGYRFLGDYRSDEQQYLALMTAGATFAQAHQLRPGIALSAAQVAQLTSDIVWLVAETLTLPDGTTTTALVPRVYLAPRAGDLADSGALFGDSANIGGLISATDVQLALSGELNNSATIAGRRLLDLSAQSIAHSGLIQGDVALLSAQEDIHITGGQVRGTSAAVASAGGDLNITSTVAQGRGAAGNGVFASQQIDRVAGLYVSGEAGVLLASAGADITLTAAQLINQGTGTLQLSAGQDLRLGAVQTGSHIDVTHNSSNHARVQMSQAVGSQLSSSGAVELSAQNHLSAQAAAIHAQDDLAVMAGGDLTIEAGQAHYGLQTASHQRASGLLGSVTVTQRQALQTSTTQASELGGQNLLIQSGRDSHIVGAHVLADQDLSIHAGRDLNIQAAQHTQASGQYDETRRSGLFSSGGLSITLGSQRQSVDMQQQHSQAAASTIGAIGGNVNLSAGQTYTQTGSDVLAPGGDISIQAREVQITEARETSQSQLEHQFKQSGLTLAITSPVISAMQTINQQIEAAGNTQSGRMQALAVANASLAGFDAYQQVQAGQGQNIHGKDGQILTGKTEADGTPITRDATMADNVGGINININLGSSRSQSNQSSSASTARGSRITAGGDVNITASGAGQNNDIRIQGSTIQAGGTTRLSAEDEVRLLAAANTTAQNSTNRSSSASVGVSMGVGGQNTGLSVNASASRGIGQGTGSGTHYTHTQVSGQTVQIESGGNTTHQGAVVQGEQVTANVGGDLLIETLQDSNRYDERQRNAGFNVSVPIGSGAASGSILAGRTDLRSNYQSATQLSGIRAGDGGFQVEVEGDTTLVGAAITSSQAAQYARVNQLQTATLSSRDLHNTASASVSSNGISLGTDMLNQGRYGLAKTGIANLVNQASDQTQQQAQTLAAISSAHIVITDEVRHQTLTQETPQQTAERLQANAQGPTHTGVSATDVQAMHRQVEAERAIKNEAVKQLTNLTDQAWKTMFIEQPKFYAVSCPTGADCIAQPELAQVRQVQGTPEEVQKQIASAEAGAVLAVNGIENPLGRAAQLAFQNAAVDQESGDKPSTIYLMHYVPATNAFAEMMVAAYEKNLASTLGHSNQTQAYAQALAERGTQETTSLGHSRGTIVQTNANQLLAQQGHTNPNLSMQGVGGAVDQRVYFEAAAAVQGDVGIEERERITYSYFSNDPVSTSRLSGGNPGAWRLSDLWQVLTTSNSMHSCYGTGAQGCTQVQNPVPGGPQGTPEGNAKLIEYRGGELYNRANN